jgi:hypothetical protein
MHSRGRFCVRGCRAGGRFARVSKKLSASEAAALEHGNANPLFPRFRA